MIFTNCPSYMNNSFIAGATAITTLNSCSLSSGVAAGLSSLSTSTLQTIFSRDLKLSYSPFWAAAREENPEKTEDLLNSLISLMFRTVSIAHHTLHLYGGMLLASCFLPVTPFTLLGALGTSTLTLAATEIFNTIFPKFAPPPITVELPLNEEPLPIDCSNQNPFRFDSPLAVNGSSLI